MGSVCKGYPFLIFPIFLSNLRSFTDRGHYRASVLPISAPPAKYVAVSESGRMS
jgi:hypothetical protein